MSRAPWLLALFLVAAFLQANHPWLTAGLWRDEAGSVYVASAPTLGDYFFRYGRVDYSPPLFDGFVGIWGRAAGTSVDSLAWFAALMATAAAAAVAFAAAEIAGRWAGLFAVLFLLDGDIVFSEFSQVRPYMLSVAAAALALACTIRLHRRMDTGVPGRWPSIALAASFFLLAFSHYAGTVAVGTMALAGLALAVAGGEKRRLFWRRVVLCAVPAGILFLFWLPAFLRQRRLGVPWDLGSPAVRLRSIADSILLMLPRFGPHEGFLSFLPAGLLAVAALALWRPVVRQWRERRPALLVLGAASAGVVGVMGWSGGASRYLVIAAACAAIFFGCLAVFAGRALKERGVGAGVVAGLGLLLAAGPIYGEIYRRAASRIGENPPVRSGIARLAALPDFDRRAIYIAVPNYFARTLWYYGVPEPNLKAFPPIRDLTDTEYSVQDRIWNDPRAVPDFLAGVRAEAERRNVESVVVIWGPNPVPAVDRSTHLILEGASRMFRLEKQGTFSGYPESVKAALFAIR